MPAKPMTASQGQTLFRKFAKEEAKGNPVISALLAIFLPFLMKLIEQFFNQYDVTPKG